jgi:low affinity Fe/Cu permease
MGERSSDSFAPRFDRFAEASSDFVSKTSFFVACVLLIVIWVPSYFVLRNVDTWQLVINTATTIVTFLLVALLQNASRRSERALHAKLDALADGLADFMEYSVRGDAADLERDMEDLKKAVGLEKARRSPARQPATAAAADDGAA